MRETVSAIHSTIDPKVKAILLQQQRMEKSTNKSESPSFKRENRDFIPPFRSISSSGIGFQFSSCTIDFELVGY